MKENNKVLDNIFFYDNYRKFLKDFFNEQKRLKEYFSQRYFAKKAGFGSHSYCTFIINGKRNLSDKSLSKMLKGLGLKGQRARYFENLVKYNQSDNMETRDIYYNNLIKLKKQSDYKTFYNLNNKQLNYYERWYYPVIRELVCFTKWGGDYKKLADMVDPKIKESEAREAVKTLESIGLIKKNSTGKYITERELLSSANVPLFFKKQSRKDVFFKGIEAVEKKSHAERYAAYSTLTINKDTYEKIIKQLDEIRKSIMMSSNEDRYPDNVYHLILELFPSSNVNEADREKYNGGRDADL